MAISSEAPPVTEKPLLIYNWLCPYVHRVTLALSLKKASVPKIDIDLENKPSWLPKYSPHGKVPTITYIEDGKQQVLYESLALVFWVVEYYTEGPELMPKSAAQRAMARIVMSRYDSGCVSGFYSALKAPELEDFKMQVTKLRSELTWLEENSALADNDGGFLLGPEPGLVDCVVAPWLLRTPLIEHFRKVDLLAKHPKLKAYTERFKQLPEVQSTFLPPGGGGYDGWVHAMNEGYIKYAKQILDFSAVDK